MGRLQAKAQVLLRLACVPLKFPVDGSLVALDVGDFEETLVDPRAADSHHPHLLSNPLGLVQSVQTHVGVHEPPIGRFRVRLQLRRYLSFLESLFELPQIDLFFAQVVMKSPGAGIAPDTRSIGVNCLIRLASRRVVAGRNGMPLMLGDAVDQGKSLAPVFDLEPHVPSIIEGRREVVVSHGEIRFERDRALEQRNSR